MRTLALLVLLAACSKVSGPTYADVSAHLATLAPRCETEPSPNGPAGYDAEVSCHDEAALSMVSVSIADDRIGQLLIVVGAPSVDTAIFKLRPALEGTCERADIDKLDAAIRAAPLNSERPTHVAIPGRATIEVDQRAPNGTFDVTVSFDYRKS
jgi:hypothetical protein